MRTKRWRAHINGKEYKPRKCPLRYKLGKTYNCKGTHRNRNGDCTYRNCPQTIEGLVNAGREVEP